MLGFKLYFDVAQNKWASTDRPTPSQFLPNYTLPTNTMFEVRRGCEQDFQVVLFNIESSDTTPVTLSVSARAKRINSFDGELVLFSQSDPTIQPLASRMTADLTLNVSSSQLDALLRNDNNVGNDLPYVDLDFQIQVNVNSVTKLVSPNALIRVFNNEKRSNDSIDAPLQQGYPDPKDLVDIATVNQIVQEAVDALVVVKTIGGLSGDVLLGTALSTTGQTINAEVPTRFISSFGGQTGDITVGAGLAMTGKSLSATAPTNVVTSFGGQTGDIVVGTGLSMAAKTLNANAVSAGVTSFGGQTGDITIGAGLAMTGKSLSATAPTNVVTSIGGLKGDVLLGTGIGKTGNSLVNSGVTKINAMTGDITTENGVSGVNKKLALNLTQYIGDVNLRTAGGANILSGSQGQDIHLGKNWANDVHVGQRSRSTYLGEYTQSTHLGGSSSRVCVAFGATTADFAWGVSTTPGSLISPWALKS